MGNLEERLQFLENKELENVESYPDHVRLRIENALADSQEFINEKYKNFGLEVENVKKSMLESHYEKLQKSKEEISGELHITGTEFF